MRIIALFEFLVCGPRESAKMTILALFTLLAFGCTPAHSAYIPRDPELLREPLYFYPPAGV